MADWGGLVGLEAAPVLFSVLGWFGSSCIWLKYSSSWLCKVAFLHKTGLYPPGQYGYTKQK